MRKHEKEEVIKKRKIVQGSAPNKHAKGWGGGGFFVECSFLFRFDK
jgi:hypothetical protein